MLPGWSIILYLLISSEIHALNKLSSPLDDDHIYREVKQKASFSGIQRSTAKFVLRIEDILPENDYGQLTVSDFIRNECRAAQISLTGEEMSSRHPRFAPLAVFTIIAFCVGTSAYVVYNELEKSAIDVRQGRFFEEVQRRLEKLGGYINKNARWTLKLTERVEGLELSNNILPSIASLFSENKIDPALFYMEEFAKLIASKLQVDVGVVTTFFPLLVGKPVACHPDNSILIEFSFPTNQTPADVVEIFDAGHIVNDTYWFYKEVPRSVVQLSNGSYAAFEGNKCNTKANLTMCPAATITEPQCDLQTLENCPSVLRKIPGNGTLHRETLNYHVVVPNSEKLLVTGRTGMKTETLVKRRVNVVTVALHHTAFIGDLKLFPTPHLQTKAFSMLSVANMSIQLKKELMELRKNFNTEKTEIRLDTDTSRKLADELKNDASNTIGHMMLDTWNGIVETLQQVLHYILIVIAVIIALTVLYAMCYVYRFFCTVAPRHPFGPVGA